jgi:hypothetical protein
MTDYERGAIEMRNTIAEIFRRIGANALTQDGRHAELMVNISATNAALVRRLPLPPDPLAGNIVMLPLNGARWVAEAIDG